MDKTTQIENIEQRIVDAGEAGYEAPTEGVSVKDQLKEIAHGKNADGTELDDKRSPEKKLKGAAKFKQAGETNEEQAQFIAKEMGLDASTISFKEDGTPLFKIDSEEGELHLPIEELVKSYQLNGHVYEKEQQFKAEKQAIETAKAKVDQHEFQSLMTAASLINLQEQQLNQEINNINWNALDAFERNRLQANFTQKLENVKLHKAQIQQMAGSFIATQAGNIADTESNRIDDVLKEAVKTFPQWKNKQVMQQELGEINGYLMSLGFTEAEIMGSLDHRVLQIARDAYMNAQAKTMRNKKSVNPSFIKPGASSASKQEARGKKQQAAKRKQAARKGDTGSIASLIADRM